MEMCGGGVWCVPLFLCFKIDGIVWKFILFKRDDITLESFKIDGIVWKYVQVPVLVFVEVGFKIDGIVWKSRVIGATRYSFYRALK